MIYCCLNSDLFFVSLIRILPMKLSSIRIVLVATSHPGNIGSTARAMKTMGLEKLYLVSPKYFPDPRAYELAAGADDVLDNAVVVDSLTLALADCHFVLATSARPRGMALSGGTPAESAALVAEHADDTEIAILFGREHAGLTNEELLHAHYHIHIPSNPDYGSLNLAQAVQIIAYELRMNILAPAAMVETTADALATTQEVEQFYTHLQSILVAINFLKLSNPKRLVQRLRRMFSRIHLEKMEINILRGILTHIQDTLKQNTIPKE